MKTRAAVAREAGKPLSIEEVDLEARRRAKYWSRGRGHRCRRRPRRQIAEEGRSRDPALHAGMPRMRYCLSQQDQSLPGDPRHPGPGPDAGRHQPISIGGKEVHAYMGCVDLLQLHRGAGNRRRRRSARTRRSTRSATSAAASPPASAPSSTRRRSRKAPTSWSSAWAALAST